MSKKPKLDAGQIHFLRLIDRDQKDGWCPVSDVLYPLVKAMPSELVETQLIGDDGWGRAKLTIEGQSVLRTMAWLR